MSSRTRPGKPDEAFPGPLEVRHLAEFTAAYARGLKDVLEVMEDAFGGTRIGGEQYVRLLEELRRLTAEDGPLATVQRECRVLLGLETAS